MCFFSQPKAPTITPIPSPPTASPEVLDNTALTQQQQLRNRLRQAVSRQSTILAGGQMGAPAATTQPAKTLLGA